jgi:hypothetical protein
MPDVRAKDTLVFAIYISLVEKFVVIDNSLSYADIRKKLE